MNSSGPRRDGLAKGGKRLFSYRLTPEGEIAHCGEQTIEPLAGSLRRGNLAFLLGAGISVEYPSLLPLVVTLPTGLPGLLDLILDSLVKVSGTIEAERLKPELRRSLLLEHVLNHLHRVLGDRAFEFLAPLDTERSDVAPNFRHRALAALGDAGKCSRFITVNFDTLLERSSSSSWYCPEKEPQEAEAYGSITAHDPRCLLLKLHGTIERREQLLTTVELVAGGLPPHKVQGLSAALRDRDLCVLGYRDSDLDVFPTIRLVSNPRDVFWYEFTVDGGRPDLPGEVRDFLREHRHTIYSGDLDLLLSSVLESQGLSLGGILASLEVSSIEELHHEDASAQARRSAELEEIVLEFSESVLSPSAASLALSLMAGDKPTLEKRLLDTVKEGELDSIASSAYWTARAERAWKLKRFSREAKCRQSAVNAIARASESATLKRWQLEYRLKLAKAQRRTGRLADLVKGLYNIALAYVYLHSSRLDHHGRGATESMVIALRGRRWYKAGLRRLVKSASFSDEGKRLVSRWYRLLAHHCFRRSLRCFRRGRKVAYQSQGWLRMHLLGLGQASAHLEGRVTDEARQAIREATKLGANPQLTSGLSNPRGHAGLVIALYDGDVAEVAKQLAYTWWYCRHHTKYIGGVRETYFLYILAVHYYGHEVASMVKEYLADYEDA